MLLRYAFRELRNSPRFCLLFCLNMTLGLTGFIALDAMKRSFEDKLQSSAKNMLAADLSVSARRALRPDEMEKLNAALPDGTRQLEILTLYSMVTSAKRSVLVELKGIDQGFPYYGQITLEKKGLYEGKQPLDLVTAPKVWVAPELLVQLDVKPGESVRIGSLDFVIDDVIQDDSSAAMIGASMAPRIYVGKNTLTQSGLIQFGATTTHTRLIQLPASESIDQVEQRVNQAIDDAGVRVSAYHKSGQDNGRMLAYLSDYLGLVSLVALALAAMGASYLFRMYLDRKQTAIATLVSIGLTYFKAMMLYVVQLTLLGAVSAVLASLVGMLLVPLASGLLKTLTPVPLSIEVGWPSFALAFGLGIAGSILVCLPQLLRIRKLNPSVLFQEFSGGDRLWTAALWASYVPSFAAFYALSLWQAHSFKVGTLFCATLLGLALIFAFIAWSGLKFLALRSRRGSLSSRLAITYLRSQQSHSLNSFIALGIGAALINLIPQIQHSIQSELQRPDGDGLPSLFLFDIQEDQVETIESLVRAESVTPKAVAPMIMARLSEVNGRPWQRANDQAVTREEEQEQRSRNRGVNLSYRSTLADAETITEGVLFQGPYQDASGKPGELSIEQRYAERLGVKLGDTLTFDVQGLPVSAIVTSVRTVKWNTFQPNFFLVLQPGLVDDAPKTFLMTLPSIEFDKKLQLQKKIVDTFPNISIIDVSKLVAKISELIEQMSLVLIVMGWLTVLTGHAVIFSIAQNQALARRWDSNLLKILGADFKVILQATMKEFGWLGAGAAVLGSILGLLASFITGKVIFKGLWQPSLLIPVTVTLALVAVCLLTSYIATRRILGEKPVLYVED
ncbi:MAG TPA: FtsX-like permease family protein [Oligoflexus sp.]|uniref:ABC transporter permease n=1 Tax=Oligoflexus sp. TaxID=1971216 RepID=UPI002D4EE40A|nr:FtsX-like permease family protein [Oligoflexus sp.]HYX39498.1 FtsX-like permease family protein [Oligoflexus sp.]